MSHDVPYWNNYNKTVRISRWHLSTPYTSSDPGFSIYFWNTEILKLGILIYVLANSIRHTFGVCSQEIKWHFQLFYRKHSSVDNRCYLVWFTRKSDSTHLCIMSSSFDLWKLLRPMNVYRQTPWIWVYIVINTTFPCIRD
jgi:hypothetical protein